MGKADLGDVAVRVSLKGQKSRSGPRTSSQTRTKVRAREDVKLQPTNQPTNHVIMYVKVLQEHREENGMERWTEKDAKGE